ncbi:hypothetical protein [Rubrivivax gelatinosus]|uniref:Fibronectin type-III domain-containing protein n=1 Tax=Rubrivivax gelatinosus TaxID=28068 RepID=A0A4R2M9R6_RUBGE|nr:hypothetical protein [Rubrivivax gelatinosus]TCP03422.1 hypothetical protein EV684_104143 [Rubrivivax gelatinosus]
MNGGQVRYSCKAAIIGGLFLAAACNAQTSPDKYVWEEFSKRVQASEKVTPLGPNFAGEAVSLSNGDLSFSATDVSLPGNSNLKVEFSRKYSVFSRKNFSNLGMLADWVVDIPSISAVFAPDWVVGSAASQQRCTLGQIPKVDSPFSVADFWQGIQLNIPGVASGELLRTSASTKKPTDGATYYWVTNEQVHVSCLSVIKNGSGEGFLVRTPDGTKYWFDWMAQTNEPGISMMLVDGGGARTTHSLAVKKNYLYVTRAEDRFGNWVSYVYGNASDDPARLTKIEASDGRVLTISYSGSTISTVSDGTRDWLYEYGDTSSGRKTLRSVTLPDGSKWGIGLSAFTNAEIKYDVYPTGGEILRDCTSNAIPHNFDDRFVGSITHPAGAVATFTVGILEHGRSYVPISCNNVTVLVTSSGNTQLSNDPNDDMNLWAIGGYSLTLLKKEVSGPGMDSAQWQYTYIPNMSTYAYPGNKYQVCDWANYDCQQPPCKNDSCAKFSVTTVVGPNSEWVRYIHGNTYRYNEGKLLRVETGGGPEVLLKTETHTYDFTQMDKVYPARYGQSLRLRGEGFQGEYHRPKIRVETVQQGTTFSRNVDGFDYFARPTAVTSSSSDASDSEAPYLDVPVLSVPANGVAGKSHTLNWTTVHSVVLYEVQRRLSGGAYTLVYSGSGTNIGLTYTGSGTLGYRVRGCNSYGTCGSYSAERSIVIAPAAIATPTIAASSPHGVGVSFNVSWTAVSGATQYVLERKVGSGAYVAIYTGSGLSKYVSYGTAAALWFRVKGCAAGGECGMYSAEVKVQIKSSTGGGGDDIEP